jgi:nucleotide-binding universal stress UspA family protein
MTPSEDGAAMIKDLIVNLTEGDTRDVAGPYAISIAETFAAHAAAVAFAYDPVIPATVMGSLPVSLIEEQRTENKKVAADAIAKFDAAAKRAGISFESRAVSASLTGAADRFGAMARRFDLSVIAQSVPDRMAPEEVIVEGALFGSGRPVVLVPYIQKSGVKLDRVIVAWDASRNAARAIADAMPFLARAKAIDVVIVASERPKSDEVAGADIGHHLARHGLSVEVKRIVATDTDVANTLLSHAADSSADFIVMGGYGHSRLREFVLGGATRGILSSMTVPVLMSH